MANDKTKPLHVQVAEKLIEQLKAGTAPWQQPWNTDRRPAFELPYNAVTGNRYRGINSISLLLGGHQDPRWATFNQASAQGWQVRKGEKGSMIQFIKLNDWITKRDEHGKQVLGEEGTPTKMAIHLSRPIVTSAWVFNAQQIDGIPPLQQQDNRQTGWEPAERTEKLVSHTGASIGHRQGDQAFYDPVDDQITMPFKQQFDSADKYYATLLHELGHWTGHGSRLDRSMLHKFGSQAYAREELRAEIASMLIGQELQIGHDPAQHIAYVDDWIKILSNSPFEIHLAAADAEKIFNYLLSFEQKRKLEVSGAQQDNLSLRRPAGSDKYLFVNEEITYQDSIYKVEGHLKQGRLRMRNLTTGNSFVLSRSDLLYDSLVKVKQGMGAATQQAGPLMEQKDLPGESYRLNR
ncbi:zincin-like metallopeptidase domain-containing protein [Mucilaginibacter sabulilitoris]|uniref:Zincin-like metallopeptidase domain-containing protein n=1 Tax=Mucilaginibacter sabulilitoris TaxID=1173583 RepID=A0ABZ0TVF3_9SPHI|nr:zincin-like metallopeptidase domain-containing protein [Mucilaginibacter sabulilitoris]WPU95779.1 zincin-like metallopeptidase domain-containing protein [Mucilaginibacter sabulilitoris]